MNIIKIIPFRLSSSRFPDKPLASVFGRTLVENALSIAEKIRKGKTVVTSPPEDYEIVEGRTGIRDRYSFDFMPTGNDCRSATERVIELSGQLDADLYVTIPVDEPALIPGEIEAAIDDPSLYENGAATLCCDFFCIEDALSKLSAKIVTDKNNDILYMSRAVIPARKDGDIDVRMLKKNVGVFFFTRDFLSELRSRARQGTTLDAFEGLEQLRWLELGKRLRVKKIVHYGFGIDVPDQIPLLEERIACLRLQKKLE